MSGFSITRRAAISAIDSFRHAPEAVELSIIASFRRVIQPLTSFRTSIPSLAKHTDHELSRFVFRTWETSLPTRSRRPLAASDPSVQHFRPDGPNLHGARSEEHTSELQSLMRISYAVFCLKKKKQQTINN